MPISSECFSALISDRASPAITVSIAGTDQEIQACQSLRYQVFVEEMGAQLKNAIIKLDNDDFDRHCLHLAVRDNANNKVVGTTRLLLDGIDKQDHRFYSQTEFELTNVLKLNGRFLEVGRTCIDPNYRNGTTIAILWQGLAQIMEMHQVDYLIGCASIPMQDGGRNAQLVMERVKPKYLSPNRLRVFPKTLLPTLSIETASSSIVQIPSLLKAYLRLGAYICGEAHWDIEFNVADVFILLDRDKIDRRYARHFLTQAA